MKKYFLSSMLVMALMSPVFGADGVITGGAGTCTVDVLGVFENDATANTIATWTLNEYECGAGQYLLNSDGTLECTECPVGSYCPGGKFTVESENNGVNTCPTDYTSDAGATGENECYMGCELVCSTNVECPPHSNNCTHSEFKTTGKQFSGETCNAYPSVCPIADFGCDAGYSKIEMNYMEVTEKYASLLGNDSLDGFDYSGSALRLYCPLDPEENTFESIAGCGIVEAGEFVFLSNTELVGFVYETTKNEYNGADIPSAIKSKNADIYLLRNADFKRGITGDNGWYKLAYILLPTPDTEILYLLLNGDIDIPDNVTTDQEILNWVMGLFSPETVQKISKIQTGDLGKLITEDLATLVMFTMQRLPLDTVWVSKRDSLGFEWEILFLNFLSAYSQNFPNEEELLGTFFGGTKYCANNIINIDWNPDNGGEHIQNMCYYDGAVTLPSDPVKPGYTFTGWKLVE